MPDQSLTKLESRQRWSELRGLMFDWDPIGVSGTDWPRDEYDCLIGPVLSMLQTGASVPEIAAYLRREIVEHFGLSAPQDDCVPIAARVRNWFERKWQDVRPPVCIFVALLEEGTDVWRPVQGRPLPEPGVFRIIGVAGDVSDEVWQFAAGAIVRCEPKLFSSGETGMVAIAELKESG